jgi:hypothetical protein
MNYLSRLWRLWLRFGQIIGNFVAFLVLTAFYYTIFVPFALVIRARHDPLMIKHPYPLQWQETPARDQTLDGARRLF